MKKVLATFLLLILTSVFSTSAFAASEEQTNLVDNLIESANKYIGVSYKPEGSTPTGFDCSGFVNYVFEKENGIEVARQSTALYQQGATVEKTELAKGDLVFFNTSGSGISHVGIYQGNNEFIHASTSKGVITSKLDDPYYWGSRYVGATRILD